MNATASRASIVASEPPSASFAEQAGIVETLRGRHLLVTGFTGFVAKVWVALLLDRVPDIGKITLLVRGRRDETANQRIRHIFERSPALRPLRDKHGARLLEVLRDKIDVVEGDAREPFLGIDPAVLAQLVPHIDMVVHCAGITDFAPDPTLALEVNVRGAEHAADVAARTPSKRFMHISTCFVAGEVDGVVQEVVRPGYSPNGTRFDVDGEKIALKSACEAANEREGGARGREARRARIEIGTRRARALGWPNIYTYSKGLAEHSLSRREDISLTIVRPSIVECAREFPFPGWNEGLNTSGPIVWMVTGYFWKVPLRAENTFDVVPVDTVARGMTVALAEALQRPSDAETVVYQLASGDHKPITIDRALELCSLQVRRGYLPKGAGPVERAIRTHMDATPLGHGADRSFVLPAAKAATTWLRDTVRRFDAHKHLPAGVGDYEKGAVQERVEKVGLKINKAAMMLRSIDALWRAYQPFIHDHDYHFVTRNVRTATSELSAEDRALFGWDLETMEWRTYWLEVEMPGLDKWSLPLLHGREAPEDAAVDLGGDLVLRTARALHKASAELSVGGAE